MYEKVLLPTDGSGISEKALDELHKITNAPTIHVVSVVDLSVYEDDPKMADTIIVENKKQARNAVSNVEKMLESRDEDYNIKTEVVEGVPEDAIIDYYKSNHLDLVLMSTHGRNHLNTSVTAKIVNRLDAPILTVGGRE